MSVLGSCSAARISTPSPRPTPSTPWSPTSGAASRSTWSAATRCPAEVRAPVRGRGPAGLVDGRPAARRACATGSWPPYATTGPQENQSPRAPGRAPTPAARHQPRHVWGTEPPPRAPVRPGCALCSSRSPPSRPPPPSSSPSLFAVQATADPGPSWTPSGPRHVRSPTFSPLPTPARPATGTREGQRHRSDRLRLGGERGRDPQRIRGPAERPGAPTVAHAPRRATALPGPLRRRHALGRDRSRHRRHITRCDRRTRRGISAAHQPSQLSNSPWNRLDSESNRQPLVGEGESCDRDTRVPRGGDRVNLPGPGGLVRVGSDMEQITVRSRATGPCDHVREQRDQFASRPPSLGAGRTRRPAARDGRGDLADA